jgi:hypothetical protein
MQLYISLILPVIHLSSDLFFLSVGIILIEYLKMLQSEFKKAVYQKNYGKIIKLVDTHRKILAFHERLNGFYAPITATNYVLNVVNSCFFAFQIIEVGLFPCDT